MGKGGEPSFSGPTPHLQATPPLPVIAMVTGFGDAS